jgi:hypothetical protein
MARQLDLHKQQRWLRHVQRWQRSQLTIRDFCARHQLGEPNFYFWLRTLKARGLLPTAPDSTAASAPAEQSVPTPLFVAATLAEVQATPQPIEIVLPDGLTVRVAAGFDAATLRQLLALLRERSC